MVELLTFKCYTINIKEYKLILILILKFYTEKIFKKN